MKNQYTGDIGDYTKLGILRNLEAADFSIGLNWYLTPDEPEYSRVSTDGRYTEYLECDCDTPDIYLHCALKEIVLSNNRTVARLERAKLLKTLYFGTKC